MKWHLCCGLNRQPLDYKGEVIVFKIMVRFKIMIILVFLNAFLNNLSTFKTGFHRLCIKNSAEDEKNSCFDQNFLKCNLNQYEVLKRNWDQNEFFSTTVTLQLMFTLWWLSITTIVYSKLPSNHAACV